MGKILAITSSPSSIPPLNHHPPLSLVQAVYAVRQHTAWLQSSDFECEWRSVLSNFDRKQKKRTPANQDITDGLPKLFEQLIVAVSVHEKKNFFVCDFSQKSGKSFLKKRKVKKKRRNSAEKRKIDTPVLCITPYLQLFLLVFS